MLDTRADYDNGDGPDLSLQEGGIEGFRMSPTPVRTRARVAAVRIHPAEMPSHDYFWGGWISMIVEQDQWILTKPKRMPFAPVIQEIPEKAIRRPPHLRSPSKLK